MDTAFESEMRKSQFAVRKVDNRRSILFHTTVEVSYFLHEDDRAEIWLHNHWIKENTCTRTTAANKICVFFTLLHYSEMYIEKFK